MLFAAEALCWILLIIVELGHEASATPSVGGVAALVSVRSGMS
jgi:hypothetical protein